MSFDRFISFKDRRPTRQQLQLVLEDYLSGAGTATWKEDRFMVDLVGTTSHPLKRIPEAHPFSNRPVEPGFEGRWFEVVMGSKDIDVLTRQQDELTMAIADGFARLCARFWHGALEDD